MMCRKNPTRSIKIGNFIRHEPCSRCGSRDNFARYSDGGGFCFGCGWTERNTTSPWVTEHTRSESADEGAEVYTMPEDSSTSFGDGACQYLSKSGVSVQCAIERGLRYSNSTEQLLFPYYNSEGKLTCLQARNFNKSKSERAKYFNKGSPSSVLPIYSVNGPNSFLKTLVITEDALSAIRIASQCDAMPALGTYVPVKKIVALAASYEFIIVWLDHDKWREAREIADNCKWLGLSAKTVFTELDPKAYTDEQINKYLTGS